MENDEECSRCPDAASYRLYKTTKRDVIGSLFCENHAIMAIESGDYSEEPTEEIFDEIY